MSAFPEIHISERTASAACACVKSIGIFRYPCRCIARYNAVKPSHRICTELLIVPFIACDIDEGRRLTVTEVSSRDCNIIGDTYPFNGEGTDKCGRKCIISAYHCVGTLFLPPDEIIGESVDIA